MSATPTPTPTPTLIDVADTAHPVAVFVPNYATHRVVSEIELPDGYRSVTLASDADYDRAVLREWLVESLSDPRLFVPLLQPADSPYAPISRLPVSNGVEPVLTVHITNPPIRLPSEEQGEWKKRRRDFWNDHPLCRLVELIANICEATSQTDFRPHTIPAFPLVVDRAGIGALSGSKRGGANSRPAGDINYGIVSDIMDAMTGVTPQETSVAPTAMVVTRQLLTLIAAYYGMTYHTTHADKVYGDPSVTTLLTLVSEEIVLLLEALDMPTVTSDPAFAEILPAHLQPLLPVTRVREPHYTPRRPGDISHGLRVGNPPPGMITTVTHTGIMSVNPEGTVCESGVIDPSTGYKKYVPISAPTSFITVEDRALHYDSGGSRLNPSPATRSLLGDDAHMGWAYRNHDIETLYKMGATETVTITNDKDPNNTRDYPIKMYGTVPTPESSALDVALPGLFSARMYCDLRVADQTAAGQYWETVGQYHADNFMGINNMGDGAGNMDATGIADLREFAWCPEGFTGSAISWMALTSAIDTSVPSTKFDDVRKAIADNPVRVTIAMAMAAAGNSLSQIRAATANVPAKTLRVEEIARELPTSLMHVALYDRASYTPADARNSVRIYADEDKDAGIGRKPGSYKLAGVCKQALSEMTRNPYSPYVLEIDYALQNKLDEARAPKITSEANSTNLSGETPQPVVSMMWANNDTKVLYNVITREDWYHEFLTDYCRNNPSDVDASTMSSGWVSVHTSSKRKPHKPKSLVPTKSGYADAAGTVSRPYNQNLFFNNRKPSAGTAIRFDIFVAHARRTPLPPLKFSTGWVFDAVRASTQRVKSTKGVGRTGKSARNREPRAVRYYSDSDRILPRADLTAPDMVRLDDWRMINAQRLLSAGVHYKAVSESDSMSQLLERVSYPSMWDDMAAVDYVM